MNCSDWSEKISDYVDGTLPAAESGALEAHLATCPACQAELASLRALLASARNLPKDIAPARDLWPQLAAQLPTSEASVAETPDTVPAPTPSKSAPGRIVPFPRFVPLAVAASVAVLLGVAAWHWNKPIAPSSPTSDVAWTVTSTSGRPSVGAKNFQGEARLRVGQWLETDAASRAKLAVGASTSIGEVSVEPNSRVRLSATSATEHRIELARGTMSALIWAPPRLFFVDTPSATAVDLGCSYTLAVDDAGNGELRVTSGYVALEEGRREAIIPNRFMCYTRRGAGPGTPFAVDASAGLKSALQRFDFPAKDTVTPSVSELLLQTQATDAVTVWHLLTRVAVDQRGAVFDALATYHAPPAGVTRAGIIAGDAAMRHTWGTELGLGYFAQQMK